MSIEPFAYDAVNRPTPSTARCAHCAQALRPPALIEWHLWQSADPSQDPLWQSADRSQDSTAILFFHPACALEFALRLLRDVHEIECCFHLGIVLTEDTAR